MSEVVDTPIYEEVDDFVTPNNSAPNKESSSIPNRTNTKRGLIKSPSPNIKMVLYLLVISFVVMGVASSGFLYIFLQIGRLKSELAALQQSSVSSLLDLTERINNSELDIHNYSVVLNLQSDNLSREMDRKVKQLNSLIGRLRMQLRQDYSAFESERLRLRMETQQLNWFVNHLHTQLYTNLSLTENTTQSLSNVTMNWFGKHQSYPATSCVAVLLYYPSSPSGHYWVRSSNGSAVRVYCDMTRSCGNITGGWMRVAELDMTNNSTQCPSGLRQHTYSNIRTCETESSSASCSSVIFSTNNIRFSRVCGKIKAYQLGSTNAFADTGRGTDPDINTYYVDGVSLTHGRPRQHIWTFVADFDEIGTYPEDYCPCTKTNQAYLARGTPHFVGNDYFCDTGSQDQAVNGMLYPDNPLWDGAGCGSLNKCCSFNNPPWFYKQLPQPTTDDIEMRVCRDQEKQNEDIMIENIYIYVQ